MATPPTPEPTDQQRQAFNRTLASLPPLPAGAVWVQRPDGKWAIDQAGSPTDHAHAAAPQTTAEHESILRRAKTFAERSQRTRNQHGWEDLHATAAAFAKAINRPTADLPDHIKRVWQDLVSLATYIDQDNDLRATPHDAMAPLPPDLRRIFSDLLVLAAPFVRGFPSARAQDEEAGAFIRRLTLHPPARAILLDARNQPWIERADVDAQLAMLKAGERGDAQSHKASAHAVASTDNLFRGIARHAGAKTLQAGMVSGSFLLGMTGNAWVNESPQWKEVGRFITRHEPHILNLTEDQPPDIRYAMRAFVTETKKAIESEIETPPPPPRLLPRSRRTKNPGRRGTTRQLAPPHHPTRLQVHRIELSRIPF